MYFGANHVSIQIPEGFRRKGFSGCLVILVIHFVSNSRPFAPSLATIRLTVISSLPNRSQEDPQA